MITAEDTENTQELRRGSVSFLCPLELSLLDFIQRNEQMEWIIPSPAKEPEIAVQSQNFSRAKFIGHLDEARVGEINRVIAIFGQDFPNPGD